MCADAGPPALIPLRCRDRANLPIWSQVAGQYQCRNEGLQPLLARVRELKAGFDIFSIQHVLRSVNTGADSNTQIEIEADLSMPQCK